MARKPMNTTIDENLMKKIRILAIEEGCDLNDLLEEGIRYILKSRNIDIQK